MALRHANVLAALVLLGVHGCSGGEEVPTTTAPDEPPATSSELPDEASALGTVEGIVRLAAGATLPSFPVNPMVSTGASAALPPECAQPSDADRQPVQVGASGGLTNLVIVATGDAERWPDSAGPRAHQARIENCRLAPRTLIAERGDTIHFENPTTFPFFPDLGTGFSRALLPTDPLDLVLDQGGVRTIQCGFANACGRMEVVTIYHPVHAVTDGEGRFRMENVPVGQDVRVTAWHPLFQEAGVQTRIESAGQTVRVALVIQPVATEAPPAPSVPEAPRDPLAGDIPE